MSYDETLAGRIRHILSKRQGIGERKMFGGLAFLLDGSMFCGIVGENLMVRVGPQHHDAALSQPHVRPMDFTGRPARGYVYVSRQGYAMDEALAAWIGRGADFVSAMPPRPPKKSRQEAR